MPIRLAREEDIPGMLQIYGPYVENTTVSFEYTTPTVAEFTDRFRRYTAQFPWLVWEENGVIAAYAYGSAPFSRAAYSWCCEVSVYVDPAFQKKHIGKRLYEALEKLLFLQGYQVIYALITTQNPASIAFHRALGYTFAAELANCGVKFGQQLGVVYMEKRAHSVKLPTQFPKPFHSFVKSDRNLCDILDNLSLS